MVPLSSPETAILARALSDYAPNTTISRAAGLLTVPNLQANTLRLEILVHLAVMHCAGNIEPDDRDFGHWLSRDLGIPQIALLEDPIEDVFITNVCTPKGNRRIFEGIWESNDYYAQIVIDTLLAPNTPDECRKLLEPVFALLELTEYVAKKFDLNRWHIETSNPKGDVPLSSETHISDRARVVTFTNNDLEELGVSREQLAPFIFRNEDKENLVNEITGHTSLERRPLVDFDTELTLALPSCVSPAIRRFVSSKLRDMGYLQQFGKAVSKLQAHQVENDCFLEIKSNTESLVPPESDSEQMPPLHSWLLKYDTNKYLHIVMLHDHMDGLDPLNLSGFIEYPEPDRVALKNYLHKVANHCVGLYDYVEGMTLIVLGGLGRAIALGFKNWPDGWGLSIIRSSDLLMLAGEMDEPVKHYLKCIKQKEWAENEGVYFQDVNGDFNFYCYWRHLNYQLVPRDLHVGDGAFLSIGTDMVLIGREKIRNLVDRHVIPMASGHFVQVMRYGREAFFKSMQNRPIYASLDHLHSGILAEVIETSRGASWLVIKPREGDKRVQNLLYQFWSGLSGLYDRLVHEIESSIPHPLKGPLEIRLNFSKLEVAEEFVPSATDDSIAEPTVTVHGDQRLAEITFPANFLLHFQRPENAGERSMLSAMAKAMISLLKESDMGAEAENVFLESLLDKIIGDAGVRILHAFPTFYPIELLMMRQENKARFIAHEDFVFAKLRLSENCVSAEPGAILKTQGECNAFLKNIADKVWGQLRDKLNQFDRASVIRQSLIVHESIIQDRQHWNRTAKAVISLYSSENDVFDVAQKREQDRNIVALSARTILEMAICECPLNDGRKISQWELDELLAKTALLIEVATDSDAIHKELIEPEIQLHHNGEYSINRDFYKEVIGPFVAEHMREEFEGAASDYTKHYLTEKPGERKRADSIYSEDFINAFRVEFGLTPDEAIDGIAELMEISVDSDSVVIETTFGALTERLINVRKMSEVACQAFLNTFGLFHRPEWFKPPEGFKEKDLYPWRFRRRLSAVVRPLLIFGKNSDDKVLFGIGAVRQGFGYLFDRIEQGQLPETFFRTNEMKEYIGAVNNKRGHEFTKSISKKLREKGWQTRHEIEMTELGAPSNLGDIDVLAWKPNREILLIECKRLQLAKTVAEIAEICRRFSGEAKDELDKHLKRVEWVRQNPTSLEKIVGFKPDTACIDDRLITNTHVPMKYLSSLPIASEKIGPIE